MKKDDVIDLIKDAGYGVLASCDGNKPKARPMMPYLTEEGDLLCATYANKRVVGQVKINPNVEMCFIDRKMNFCRVSGKATVSKDMGQKEMIWNNVPMLRQHFSGPEDPNFVIIKIDTAGVEAMTPQQQMPDVLSLKESMSTWTQEHMST